MGTEQGPAAVVTGAASGIGRAIARRLTLDGYGVHAVDRDAEGLASLQHELREAVLSTHQLDVGDAAAVATACGRLREAHGAPWALVNNAATGRASSLLDTTPEEWHRVLSVDLTAPFNFCREILPGMLEAGGGVVVNISSAAAVIGLRARFAYSTAKAGLLGLTRSVAADYGAGGIRCNAICPGTIDTPWNRRIIAESEDPAATEAAMHARSFGGRMGRPEDIAGGVAFLVGEDGQFLNGAVLVMDGGMTIRQ